MLLEWKLASYFLDYSLLPNRPYRNMDDSRTKRCISLKLLPLPAKTPPLTVSPHCRRPDVRPILRDSTAVRPPRRLARRCTPLSRRWNRRCAVGRPARQQAPSPTFRKSRLRECLPPVELRPHCGDPRPREAVHEAAVPARLLFRGAAPPVVVRRRPALVRPRLAEELVGAAAGRGGAAEARRRAQQAGTPETLCLHPEGNQGFGAVLLGELDEVGERPVVRQHLLQRLGKPGLGAHAQVRVVLLLRCSEGRGETV